ncbi:hypothetical protein KKE14_03390 [Patescibacteria group bacterium]|nr:hypothetical protein [Patescibacteria group bacterium]
MNKLDSGDMYTVIANYPKQFATGLRSAEVIQLSSDIDKVVIVAAGTNALMAKVITEVFESNIKTPFIIHPGDESPVSLTNKTLVVAIDLTGKWASALSTLENAHKIGCQIVVVTSGQKAEVFAREKGLPLVLTPGSLTNIPERMLSGYVLSVLVQLLINCRVLEVGARLRILKAIEVINQLYLVQQAKQIVDLIKGYLLLVYAHPNYSTIIEMAKIKFNLNCKLPSFASTIPEVIQNEAAGFNVIKNLRTTALIFDDTAKSEVSSLEMEKLTNYLTKFNIKYLTIPLPGNNKLEKILGSMLLTDWISYWLALSMNVDPTPTPILDNSVLK